MIIVSRLNPSVMKYIDLTLPTPQENLACDEALLDMCEAGYPDEILRFWQPRHHFVVLGYSNKIHSEVNLPSCRALNIPVLRRCSGGGTVLQGPGCLNYSLILRLSQPGPLQGITQTNTHVMGRNRDALAALLKADVRVQGHTDLTVQDLKFSGNSQRRKRHFLLFHGTLLLNLDLSLVETLLAMPSRQPAYRRQRPHCEFLTNLNLPSAKIKHALRQTWDAHVPLESIPHDAIHKLVTEKYDTDEWNFKF